MAKDLAEEKAITLKDVKVSELFGLHRPGNSVGADLSSYVRSLGRTPLNVRDRAFNIPSIADTQARLESDTRRGHMKKSLNWFDLMNLGIGIILGAGVFVVTGTVANGYSGGATVMAYFIAGVSAFLSSLCYSEYAVEFPVAGGSFTFILYTFGEFWAWITATNLIFNYVLANAAVARSFAPYFGQLCDQGGNFLVVVSGSKRLDFCAFTLILVLSILLCWGMKETKTVNNIITVVHVAVVIFIIIAGLTQAEASNFTYGGWAPYGVRGVFNGASLVFFSYIGFDAIATTAEEVKNPGRDIPLGMTLALCVVTSLYLLCAIALTLMLPYTEINPDAAFSAAFVSVGMHWASYIVAVGALLGITTGVMVGLLAVARAVTALGREAFIPPIFALVSVKLGTPIFTTAILGVVTAIIALFTAFDSLLNLVSVCTLFTFYVVAMGVLYRHYHLPGKTKPWLALFVMFWFTATSLALSVYYEKSYGWVGIVVPGILWLIGCIALMFVPQAYQPKGFSVPLMPWIPAGSIILNIFLMSTLGSDAFKQWGIFIAAVIVIYFLFSLPNIVLQLDIDAPARAEWEAQQAANKASGYVEDGKGYGEAGRGYGEVEMADKPIQELDSETPGFLPTVIKG